jgi:uncharacterized iron-regulated membrane protein
MSAKFWRQWHRWVGFPAALFLLFASATGILVAGTEFFGEEEARREATRDLISPLKLGTTQTVLSEGLTKAFATAAGIAPGAPVDKVSLEFKGDVPTLTISVGKPTGGEDRRLVFDQRNGTLLRTEAYVDKPLIHRIHSGEFFGDGGLVGGMLWGLALVLLTISGLIVYVKMWRPGRTGLGKVFW